MNIYSNFWETKFQNEKTGWGDLPSDSAIWCLDFFKSQNVQHILIPGIGYGRNAKIFLENNINVTGIEISQTAINLANEFLGRQIEIYHGSVIKMPFDTSAYDGIFCYALIHLLNLTDRRKVIQACYNHLKKDAYMVFTVISTKSEMFRTGKPVSINRYMISKGLTVFFYDEKTIKEEFGKFGLQEFKAIDEPIKNMADQPPLKLYRIVCKKLTN